jgi:hypothetical protein
MGFVQALITVGAVTTTVITSVGLYASTTSSNAQYSSPTVRETKEVSVVYPGSNIISNKVLETGTASNGAVRWVSNVCAPAPASDVISYLGSTLQGQGWKPQVTTNNVVSSPITVRSWKRAKEFVSIEILPALTTSAEGSNNSYCTTLYRATLSQHT